MHQSIYPGQRDQMLQTAVNRLRPWLRCREPSLTFGGFPLEDC